MHGFALSAKTRVGHRSTPTDNTCICNFAKRKFLLLSLLQKKYVMSVCLSGSVFFAFIMSKYYCIPINTEISHVSYNFRHLSIASDMESSQHYQ